MVNLEKLQPNPKNTNKHPPRQIELLAKIISYQGQRAPIVVSRRSGFIVKGHARLDAISKLGWDQAAVDYQDYESEAQEFADLIADNRIAELAEHDENAMIDGIKALDMSDFDFELLGLPDLSIFTAGLGEIDEKPTSGDGQKKYIIEAQFPNDMEMMEVHDDLLNRGYIVKVI